jgi:Na+-driven multidrug efflux pump
MNPKYAPALFFIGMVIGGILALWALASVTKIGLWNLIAIVVGAYILAGILSLYLLRRQNRRRR